MGELFQPTHLLILLIVFGAVLCPHWMIFKKAGFSPWLSLLLLIPIIGTIVLYVVAFSPWRVVPTVQLGGPPTGYPPAPTSMS